MLRTKMKLTDIGFAFGSSQLLDNSFGFLDFWITIDIKFSINQLQHKDATTLKPAQEHYFSFLQLQ